jgi:hypothetical protein
MPKTGPKTIAGFDALMPSIHVVARRRGLTSASWLRMVVLEALDRATPASSPQEAT